MKKIVFLYGLLLAVVVVLLKVVEYRYWVGRLSVEIYTGVVATIFTGVGVWIGLQLVKTGRKEKIREAAPAVNEANLKELGLNKREYEVLQLIAAGHSNQEIADKLFIALPTVKTHTSNLYAKLGVKRRTQAIYRAKELDIIV